MNYAILYDHLFVGMVCGLSLKKINKNMNRDLMLEKKTWHIEKMKIDVDCSFADLLRYDANIF